MPDASPLNVAYGAVAVRSWTAPDTQEPGVAVAAVAGCRQTRIPVAAGGTLAGDQASSRLGAVVTPGVKVSQPAALRRRPRRWTDR